MNPKHLTDPAYTVQPPPGFLKALRLGQVSQGFARDAWACAKEFGRVPTLKEVREWRRDNKPQDESPLPED